MPDITPALTAAHVTHLRQPFTPEAVKWRADAKRPDGKGDVRCVLYIDSRLAIERLSEVDPCWTDSYKAIAASPGDPLGVRNFAPVLCALTVHGVTRYGMGQLGNTKEDSKYAKSVVSDALKRAAVQFGVGAYLYAMPVFKVPKGLCWVVNEKDERSGKEVEVVKSLNKEAITSLRKQYAKVVEHKLFQQRFGEPIDYGDVADDERSIAVGDERDDEQLDTLFEGAAAKGRPVTRAPQP